MSKGSCIKKSVQKEEVASTSQLLQTEVHWTLQAVSLFSASLVAPMVKNLPAMIEGLGSIPWSGRSPGGGHGNPVQYDCLGESPCTEQSSGGYSRGGVSQSQTWLSSSTDVSFSILVDSEERLWWFESVALKQIHYHVLTKTNCEIALWVNFPGLSLCFLSCSKEMQVSLELGVIFSSFGGNSVIAYYLLICDINNYINNKCNKYYYMTITVHRNTGCKTSNSVP